MSHLKMLSQQIQDGTLPLTQLEALAIRHIREFPKAEQMKVFDLLSRFSMAKRYTGEICFNFHWLLEAEKGFDAMVDEERDVLKGVIEL